MIGDLSPRDVAKIQRTLGAGAIDTIRDNPYILSRMFSLKVVDKIAAKFGVSLKGNMHRGVAIAEYELDKATYDGHCSMHTHTLCAKAKQECKLAKFDVGDLVAHGTIVVEGQRAMLATLHAAEVFVADQIASLIARPLQPSTVSLELAAASGLSPDKAQTDAILAMQSYGVCVVTGAPGTGKTSCTRLTLDMFDKDHVTYALCAPTGKAARRLGEVTGRKAATIHRLLGWRPDVTTGEWYFECNEGNPLQVDVLLVDESSMIDIKLAADLLAAVDPARTRVVFIGDVEQLPPVGPGSFFADLIASGAVNTVRLETLHRAAATSWIYRNAPKILAGKDVELDTDAPDFMWYEIESGSADMIPDVALDVISKLLEEGETWDTFQLIAPMKIKQSGTIELNQIIGASFKREGTAATIGQYEDEREVRRGDRVIQQKNDYNLDVYNGEVGEVAIVEKPSQIRVRFGAEYKDYKGAALRNLGLSYALTIHRTQGSEWPIVIVVCHSVHSRMLNRKLFYTAVTRARKRVIVIGDERGVMQAIRGVQDVRRRTHLVARIIG